MTIESDIVAVLEADVALTALISTRIYPMRLPQNPTWPNLVYSRSSTDFHNTISTNAAGQANARFQLDCRADDYAEVRDVAAKAITAMTGAAAFDALIVSDSDFPYEPDTEIYRTVLDFSVWY